MQNIAIFASGNGTNFQAIADAIKSKKLKGVAISLMVSDNPAAYALERAKKAGIKSTVIERDKFSSMSEFEKEILKQLSAAQVELIALAGFMRIIGPDILSAYKNKILNIHPALLPSFKGAHGIKDAFEYGVKVTGVTAHFVDNQMDHGPIIMQEAVPIAENDTLESLEVKIHEAEHKLYYQAIGLVASGKATIAGRKVAINEK